jgi:hypothetical protein
VKVTSELFDKTSIMPATHEHYSYLNSTPTRGALCFPVYESTRFGT